MTETVKDGGPALIEAVAKAIARDVPIVDGGGRWNPGCGENFPENYTDVEVRLIRAIADTAVAVVLFKARGTHD